jgi:hypothetical protein
MKHHGIFIALAFFLIAAIPVSAELSEDQIRVIIDNAQAGDDQANAEAIMLYRNTEVIIPDMQHRTVSEEVLLKLVSGQSKNKFGDYKAVYDSRYEQINVKTARTFLPDGSISGVMEGADNVMTPDWLMDAAMYGSIKQRVVSFSGAESGAVLHWRVIRTTEYPSNDRFLSGEHLFQRDIPILAEKYSLQVHSSVTLSFRLMNQLQEPVLTSINDQRIFSWDLTGQPMIQKEWGMIPLENIAPRLLYTTASSWQAIGEWFRQKFEVHAGGGPEIDELTAQLTGSVTNSEEKINAIYRYVSDNVRDIGLPLGLDGYEPNDPGTILHNRYGDSKDKSLLLTAMLRKAGFQADPMMYQSGDVRVPADFPSTAMFDRLGVIVDASKGNHYWLDTEGSNLRMGFFPRGQGSASLRIKPVDIEINYIPILAPDESVSRQEMRIMLQPDGKALIHLKWQGSGYFDAAARTALRNKTPAERENYFGSRIAEFDPAGQLMDVKQTDWKDLEKDAVIEMDIECASFGIIEGSVMIVPFPSFPIDFAHIDIPSGTNRLHAARLASTATEEINIVLIPPPGFETIYTPSDKEKSSPGLKARQKIKVLGTQFEMNRKSIYRLIELNPEQFGKTKAIYDQFRISKQNLVLLEKTTSAIRSR